MTLYKVQLPEGHLEARGMQDANWQNFSMFQDYAESTMNELLGLYGFEKFDRTETEHLNVDRFTSPKADDSLSPLDDASRDDVSVGSCDSSSGRSDLSRYNRSKFGGTGISCNVHVFLYFCTKICG